MHDSNPQPNVPAETATTRRSPRRLRAAGLIATTAGAAVALLLATLPAAAQSAAPPTPGPDAPPPAGVVPPPSGAPGAPPAPPAGEVPPAPGGPGTPTPPPPGAPVAPRLGAPGAPPLLGAPGGPPPLAPGAPGRPAPLPPVPLEGTIQAYNYAPDGSFESVRLALADGRVVQVNFPPHAGTFVAAAAAAGDRVKVTAEPRMGLPDQPTYELASLTGKDGRELKLPRPDDAPPPAAHVDGTVQRLNYDRQGRPNGAVLDGGVFVNVGPDQAVALKLAQGQKLSVDGPRRVTLSGTTVVEATAVNGTTIDRPAPVNRPIPIGREPRPPR